jgi:hypothetical protein
MATPCLEMSPAIRPRDQRVQREARLAGMSSPRCFRTSLKPALK